MKGGVEPTKERERERGTGLRVAFRRVPSVCALSLRRRNGAEPSGPSAIDCRCWKFVVRRRSVAQGNGPKSGCMIR